MNLKIKLRQHIPNFSDCDPQEWEVDTISELFDLDWVKFFTEDFDGLPFYRFSQKKICPGINGNKYTLIAEWKNQKEHKWWVVGYLSRRIELPKFLGAATEGEVLK